MQKKKAKKEKETRNQIFTSKKNNFNCGLKEKRQEE